MSVHVIDAKFLLLEVCTTTLSPSIWHMKSVHITDPSFYCERSTTTLSPSIWHLDVNTHDWGTVYTAGGLYYYIESQYLTHKVSTHPWRQVSTAKGQYNFIVSNIWHMKSEHITETKILLLEVSTTTLSPSIWHQVVSIYDGGKVSFAEGLYNYIESKYLTTEVTTYH